MVSARPSKASGKSLKPRRRAEPVSRNLPGRGSRSTSRLMASSNSWTRWISSIISKPSCRTKALGSASAAARTAWSSRYSSRAPPDLATISSARVLLPTCPFVGDLPTIRRVTCRLASERSIPRPEPNLPTNLTNDLIATAISMFSRLH